MKLGRTLLLLCFLLAFNSIATRAQDLSKPGTQAPSLQVTKWLQPPAGFDGQWSRLRGKVVVLEFWATWCSPCVHAIPHLNQLANEFHSQDVVFLAVTDDDEDHLKPFLAKQPMDAIIGIDTDRKSWKAFGVPFVPHTIVIDKDGAVIGATLPENVTSEVLREVLAGKKPVLPSKEGVESDLEWDDHLIEWQDGVRPVTYAIIKPIKTTTAGLWPRQAHLTADGVGLDTLVQAAYETDHFHLDWRMPKDDQTYRVAIRVPEDRKSCLLSYMRQTLGTVFGIQARWENHERDVYVLRRIEGQGGLSESRAEHDLVQMMKGKITLRHQSVKRLCDLLTNSLESLVVDETGMNGLYDFDVPYQHGQPEVTTQALRGLGFEAIKARRSVPILVVGPESAAKQQ